MMSQDRSGSADGTIRGWSRRRLSEGWGAGLMAVASAVVLLPAFALLGVTVVDFNDVDVYRMFGRAILAGEVPYRDISIEYPPAALGLFLVPALATSSAFGYKIAFAVLVGGMGMAGLALSARLGTLLAPTSRAWLLRTLAAGVTVGLLGAVALTRFDFAPAALAVAALYALLRDRFGWAGGLLGAAVAVKVYPVVILPVAAAYVLRRGGRRAAAGFIAVTAVVVVITYLPFLLVAPDGVYESLRGQIVRPLQIESSGGSLLWLATEAGLVRWPQQELFYDVRSPAAEAIQALSTVCGVAVLALVWWRHARGPADATRLVRYALASILGFVVFGKVLSPQYLLWLVLLVPAVRGSRANAAAWLLAAAALATAIYFPRWFPAVVEDLAPHGLAAIAVRNLLLAVLLVVLAWRVEDVPARAAA